MFKCFKSLTILIMLGFVLPACTNKKTTEIGPEPIPPPLPPGTIPDVPPAAKDRGDGFTRFDVFETQILADLVSIPEQERLDSRYLILCDRSNESDPLMQDHIAASHKIINQLSVRRRKVNTVGIGNDDCIRRIDLTDYGITRQQWRLIEDGDEFQLESNTERGLLIKQLTQARRPWMHLSNFALISYSRGVVIDGFETNRLIYYEILEMPATIQELYVQLGVDRQANYDQSDPGLIYMGTCDSPIALEKCRSIERMETDDGAIYLTFDISLNSQENLKVNPFPPESRSLRVFRAEAHEAIFTLPNGLNGYVLAGAATGELESFAPTNIVQNNRSGSLDPTINIARCMQCHVKMVEDNEDELRRHILGNQNFNIDDRRFAEDVIRPDLARLALFNQDTEQYCEEIEEIGNSCADIDTQTQLTDDFQKQWNLQQLGAYFFLDDDDMIACIRSSEDANQEIGDLAVGGTASLVTIKRIKQDLIDDCALFEDRRGE